MNPTEGHLSLNGPDGPNLGLKAEQSWRFVYQIGALILKTLLVQSRKPLSLLLFIASPSIAILVLHFIQYAVVSSTTQSEAQLSLQKCVSFDVYGQVTQDPSFPCVTVAFAVEPSAAAGVTDSAIATMRHLAKANGLCYSGDGCDGPGDVLFSTPSEITNAMYERPGSIEAAVIFSSSTAYELWVNASASWAYSEAGKNTLLSSHGIDGRTMALEVQINGGIIAAQSPAFQANPDALVDLQMSVVPFTEITGGSLGGSVFPVVFLAGGAFITIGLSVSGILAIYAVTTEKRRNLLNSMRQMGVSEAAYWASWLVVFATSGMFGALLAVGTGHALDLWVFSHVNFAVHFYSIWAFCIAMVSYGLWLSSFLTAPRWINVVIFITLTLSTIEQFLFPLFQLFVILPKPSINAFVKFLMFMQPW